MVSSATDTRERVGVAEGDEPAPAANDPAEVKAPLSLKRRMAAIRVDAFGIGKDTIKMKSKAGVEFTIKGHTIEAVLSEMRPLLDEHEIDLWPYLIEKTYVGNRCDVTIDWTFERLDESDEKRVVRWAGAGTDDGDKGFSKAGTNCLKEMLKKVFLITDRDDAKEEEEKVEHKTEDRQRQAAVAQSEAKSKAATATGLNNLKSAIEKATEEADIDRLRRDNKDLLDDESLPAVTRTFFVDLMARRKAELSAAFPGDQ